MTRPVRFFNWLITCRHNNFATLIVVKKLVRDPEEKYCAKHKQDGSESNLQAFSIDPTHSLFMRKCCPYLLTRVSQNNKGMSKLAKLLTPDLWLQFLFITCIMVFLLPDLRLHLQEAFLSLSLNRYVLAFKVLSYGLGVNNKIDVRQAFRE